MVRYMLLPATFSMFLVTFLVFEIGLFLHWLLEERLQRYRLSPDLTAASFALLLILPAIYLNYKYIRQFAQDVVYAGELTREVVEGTIKTLPQGQGESAIIYLNLPNTVQSKAVLSLDNYVAFNNMYTAALDLYCRQPGMPNYYRNIRLAYIDLGYDIVKLPPKA